MAILKKNAFSRRVPDLVTEELVAVLSRRSSFEFKQLFDIVHENLRARNAASGGEEMLRLRAYEKLQNLVARGAVKKNGKKYKGLPSALASAIAPQNGHIPAAAIRKLLGRSGASTLRDYLPVLLQIIVAVGFVASALIVSLLLQKAGRRSRIKDSPYEGWV